MEFVNFLIKKKTNILLLLLPWNLTWISSIFCLKYNTVSVIIMSAVKLDFVHYLIKMRYFFCYFYDIPTGLRPFYNWNTKSNKTLPNLHLFPFLNKGEDDLFLMGQLGTSIVPLSLKTKTMPVSEMYWNQLETSYYNNNNTYLLTYSMEQSPSWEANQ